MPVAKTFSRKKTIVVGGDKGQKVAFKIDTAEDERPRKRSINECLVTANQTMFRRVGGKLDDAPRGGFAGKPDITAKEVQLSQAPTAAGTVGRADLASDRPVSERRSTNFNKTGLTDIHGESEKFGTIRTLTKFGVRTNGFTMRNFGAVKTIEPEGIMSLTGYKK